MQRLLDFLFPYQRAIVLDSSRFKLLNCSRQCGKSTMLAVESVMNSILTPRDKWVCLSRGERQVLEWISKVAEWAEYACTLARADGLNIDFTPKRERVDFSNGSSIIGLPANPDTARGYSANVLLDEFAYHHNPDAIWAAVFPYISNNVSHQWKLRVASTVAGRNNKFWKLYAQRASAFRKYKITIDRAIADGLPMQRNELKRAIGDDDIWKQEYECIPVEGTTTLLSYELINAAQSPAAQIDIPLSELDRPGSDYFLGIDIGRKHDLTVLWLVELIGNRIITRKITELLHAPFAEQEQSIDNILKRKRVVRAAIDATGIGAQLAETFSKRYAGKVEAFNFTAQLKKDLYLGMQTDFQAGNLEIPLAQSKGGRIPDEYAERIVEDLHSVQRVFTSGGNLLFYAPTNEDGHSDRASALALCLHALRTHRAHSVNVASPRSALPDFHFGRAPRFIN